MVFNPGPAALLETGDLLITVGKENDVLQMAEAISETTMPNGD